MVGGDQTRGRAEPDRAVDTRGGLYEILRFEPTCASKGSLDNPMTDGDDANLPARPASKRAPPESRPGVIRPDPSEIDRLLAAARSHPLGVEFLMNGYLGSVAVTFGVHAFAVEAARERVGAASDRKGDRDGLP